MKSTKIIYWIFTILLLLIMLPGAVMDVINSQNVVDFMHVKLGYPNYVAPFLGVAKILGCVAILIPGLPKVKEWAYAGLVFDISGALYSGIAAGFAVKDWGMLVLFLGIVIAAYVYYRKKLNMAN